MDQGMIATQYQQQNNSRQSSGKGLKAITIITSIIAICGIGFGIYGMIQKNSNTDESAHASDFKVQITDEDGTTKTLDADMIEISDDSQTITIKDSDSNKKNPIIESADKENKHSYGLSIVTPTFDTLEITSHSQSTMHISINDGKISNCHLSYDQERECNILGISGRIYKAEIFNEGQAATGSKIAFIMEDGTVYYAYLKNMIEDIIDHSSTKVIKKVKIDGFVTDIIHVDVTSLEYYDSWVTPFFILSDGSYIKYSDSLLES